MKHIRRLFVGILAGLALVMVMGGAATPAAAATKLFVNDTTANDPSPSYCTSGLSYTTIEAAVAALTTTSNVTITICRGYYTPPGPFNFTGFTNLKIIGKGSPIITAPTGFSGMLFGIHSSSKVTVQGLNIDGQGLLSSTTPSAAIYLSDTSGTIKGNTISRWHQSYSGTPPIAVGTTTYGIVDYAPGLAKKVTIQNNSIYDSQDVGIYVQEGGKAKVIKNRVVFSSAITPASSPPGGGDPVQVGIILLFTAPGAVVSGNQIQSDTDLFPLNTNSRGILLYSTSGAKVTKNTVRGTAYQISIESRCDNPLFPNANKNKITGNKLYDSWWNGVVIWADSTGGGCATPHADRNTATGNKIYNSRLNISTPFGAWVFANGTGVVDRPTIKNNTFAGFLPGVHIVSGTGGSGVVSNPKFTPNKVLVAPPPGPQASPSSTDHPAPAPLPAALLNMQ